MPYNDGLRLCHKLYITTRLRSCYMSTDDRLRPCYMSTNDKLRSCYTSDNDDLRPCYMQIYHVINVI